MKKQAIRFAFHLILGIFSFICTIPVCAQSSANNAESYYEAGVDFANKEMFAEAVKMYTESAQLGYMAAQYELGCYYYNGWGVEKNLQKAVEWWTKAATNTNDEKIEKFFDDNITMEINISSNAQALAKYYLSNAYAIGEGVTQNEYTAAEWLKSAALDGYSDAQFYLGNRYYNGAGVAKNIFAAFHWWEKAAEQGHTDAKWNLGSYYYNGWGGFVDLSKAGDLYCEAAQADYPSKDEAKKAAQKYLDEFMEYETDFGTLLKAAELGNAEAQDKYAGYMSILDEDIRTAILWWTQAAKQGNAEAKADLLKFLQKQIDANNATAQLILGQYYSMNGDIDRGLELIYKAANNGSAEALFTVAIILYNSSYRTTLMEHIIEYYTKAAEQGYAAAQFNLWVLYSEGKDVALDMTKAIHWLTKVAEQGDAAAQNNLAIKYMDGESVPQNYSKAIEYFTLSAEQGETAAQYNLSVCYTKPGASQDYEKAAYWCRKAAEGGDKASQYNLGVKYEIGRGVTQDYDKAAYWYNKAAQQGQADAMFKLGQYYELGRCVTKNLKKAEHYYSKAADLGSEAAVYALAFLKILNSYEE